MPISFEPIYIATSGSRLLGQTYVFVHYPTNIVYISNHSTRMLVAPVGLALQVFKNIVGYMLPNQKKGSIPCMALL